MFLLNMFMRIANIISIMLRSKRRIFPVLINPSIVLDIDHRVPTELIINVTGSRNKGKKGDALSKRRGVAGYRGVVDPCCALGSVDND